MEITLATPALLFPAISLLLLAYTNRFLALSNLVRNLHSKYEQSTNVILHAQIKSLEKRVMLTRSMQAFGTLSILGCVVCMFVIFAGYLVLGKYIFGISLLLLIVSLAISFYEINISVEALKIQLNDMDEKKDQNR